MEPVEVVVLPFGVWVQFGTSGSKEERARRIKKNDSAC
jgi:hypothetical protein